MKPQLIDLPVAVIGAGPVGLAAAAHLLDRGFTPLVLEAGATVAANLESYRHVRMFSPWRYNIDRAARALLADAGWRAPDLEELPTAGEIIDSYLAPLAALPAMRDHVKFGHSVTSLSRLGFDKVKTKGREIAPFLIRARTPDGHEQEFLARAVIDASGTWSQPNPIGSNGIPASGETELAAHIHYGMPDILGSASARYAGKRVLVIGAGHSAAGNLIALADLAGRHPGTTIAWAIRGTSLERVFGGGAADQLPARGALGLRLRAMRDSGQLEIHTGFKTRSLVETGGRIAVRGEGGAVTIEGIDEIIASTGARPRLDMARELRVRLDPWLESTDALAPLIDPNMHSCGTVRPHGHRELAHPEAGFYAVGAKSYGRAPNFLMATGYEQVRSIAAALAGDMQAADDVQLDLPETGVCSTRQVYEQPEDDAGCCGGPAPAGSDACCALDAAEAAAGNGGCASTCGTSDPAPRPRASCCG